MSTPNDHTFRSAKPLRRMIATLCLALGGAAGASGLAAADAVTGWNAIATTTIFNAQPTEREQLNREQRGIDARLDNDCGGH